MKNLSPQTRQKLAILLKSRAKAQGSDTLSPNLGPPPIQNALLKVPSEGVNKPVPLAAQHMMQPQKFGLLRNKFR